MLAGAEFDEDNFVTSIGIRLPRDQNPEILASALDRAEPEVLIGENIEVELHRRPLHPPFMEEENFRG